MMVNRNGDYDFLKFDSLNQISRWAEETSKHLGTPFKTVHFNFQNCIDCMENEKILVITNCWENHFKILKVTNKDSQEHLTLIKCINYHQNVINCCKINKEFLAIGSQDSSISIWKMSENGQISESPLIVIYSQLDQILCVDLNVNLDIVVSGSKDGRILINHLNNGKVMKNISFKDEYSQKKLQILFIKILFNGKIIAQLSNKTLILISLNGKVLKKLPKFIIKCWAFSKNHDYMFCGVENTVYMIKVSELKIIFRWKLSNKISALQLSQNDNYLIVGFSDGEWSTIKLVT